MRVPKTITATDLMLALAFAFGAAVGISFLGGFLQVMQAWSIGAAGEAQSSMRLVAAAEDWEVSFWPTSRWRFVVWTMCLALLSKWAVTWKSTSEHLPRVLAVGALLALFMAALRADALLGINPRDWFHYFSYSVAVLVGLQMSPVGRFVAAPAVAALVVQFAGDGSLFAFEVADVAVRFPFNVMASGFGILESVLACYAAIGVVTVFGAVVAQRHAKEALMAEVDDKVDVGEDPA